MPPLFQFLFFTAIALAALAYLVGYATAWHTHQEDRARNTKIRLRLTKERNEMASWVRANWPTEFDAYRTGIADGYQQGVVQSDVLETTE